MGSPFTSILALKDGPGVAMAHLNGLLLRSLAGQSPALIASHPGGCPLSAVFLSSPDGSEAQLTFLHAPFSLSFQGKVEGH